MEEMAMLDDTVQRRIPIPILVCDDIAAMHAWLVRVFGLVAGRLEHDTEGRRVHGELKAGDGVIWLHQVSPQFGLASPKTLGAATGTTAVIVEDVEPTTSTLSPKGSRSSTRPPTSPTATASTAPLTPKAASGHS